MNKKSFDILENIMSRPSLPWRTVITARGYLKRNNYKIIEGLFGCELGSIDIIARDEDGTWCFVEVDINLDIEAGFPDEEICNEKQERFEHIALSYLTDNDDYKDQDRVRFDTIGICMITSDIAVVRHHKNIFQLD